MTLGFFKLPLFAPDRGRIMAFINRLIRSLSKPDASRLNVGIERHGVVEGLHLYTHDAPDVVSDCVRKWGTWEPAETEFILQNVKAGQVAIDLGAHFGFYTTILGKLVGKHGRVIALEPHDDNHSLLMRNVALNQLENTQVLKAIAGDRAGVGVLHEFGEGNSGAHQAVPHGGNPQFAKTSLHPMIKLDDLMKVGVDRVDFIKMDTQGSEPFIFSGGRELIKANAKHLSMIVEFNVYLLQHILKIRPRAFYDEIIGIGFKASYLHPHSSSVHPIEDIDALIKAVLECDGKSWPKNHNFVDLVLVPR
jgi:FkbM family methyltransferase